MRYLKSSNKGTNDKGVGPGQRNKDSACLEVENRECHYQPQVTGKGRTGDREVCIEAV